MPKRILEEFKVEWFQLLDEQGRLDASLLSHLLGPTEKITPKEIQAFYESMVLIRAFDKKALKLQRMGRLGTYPAIEGQEAIQVGCAAALKSSDWFFPAFRETGISILRGLPMKTLYQYWSGDERGNVVPETQNDFPVSIPVGTHIPHAVGAAWAAKYKQDKIAVLTTFGDGATSKGDFHEGLNFAGVFNLPVVFLCQNNQWAISVPVSRQTASKTLAQKAIAYGFPGIQVDGNDVIAVYLAVKRALEAARQGKGPTLIECLTYRLSDHTTADDASRYRSEEEVAQWRLKDPMRRLKSYLEKNDLWSAEQEKTLQQGVEARISAAVADYESAEPMDPLQIFDSLFESLPNDLLPQRAALARRIKKEKEEAPH